MKKKLIIFGAIILLFILGVCAFLWYKNLNNDGNSVGKIGDLPGTSLEELQKKADSSKFSFEINSNPIFKNGDSEGNLRIANPHYNTFPIEVTIRLKSNDEVIFKTGKMQPNHYIENAKLSKHLAKGSYEAVATIKAFDSKNNDKYLGEAKAILNVTIKN